MDTNNITASFGCIGLSGDQYYGEGKPFTPTPPIAACAIPASNFKWRFFVSPQDPAAGAIWKRVRRPAYAISKNRMTVSPCLSILISIHGATSSSVSRLV